MRKYLVKNIVLMATALLANSHALATVDSKAVLENYADIAHAVFEDSLITAQHLQVQVDALIEKPSEETLAAAKDAWIQARVPYQQSEVFRFGNANVDEWEGQVNAWPLDEGLIDYVNASYEHEMGNIGATANVVANTELIFGADKLDVSEITPELLASLNELGGSEANVATGYHAIEFLLWGQDLNGTNAGAGQRSHTDYIQGKGCTNGNCDRRAAYLKAATELLISDLEEMVSQWQAGADNYRAELVEEGQNGLRKMLFGMGSLSLGELAGERMKVSLEANSPEDEHDCFSDNTHNSHYYNAKGIRNVYLGEYKRVDGSTVSGASLSDLVKAKDEQLDVQMRADLDATDAALMVMVDTAEGRADRQQAFDQMIANGNKAGQKIITDAIVALVTQTRSIEQVANTIGIDNLEPDTADHAF